MQVTDSPFKALVIDLFAASKRTDKALQALKDRRYQGLTVAQLKEIAKERNIKGRSRAKTKAALVKLLQAS